MSERSYGKKSKYTKPDRSSSGRDDAVRAKKHLGQHFLKDLSIAERIAGLLTGHNGYKTVLEIGPGMGVLTQYLLKDGLPYTTHVIEIDTESIVYLNAHFPALHGRILEGDFLKMDLSAQFPEPVAIIGNFPYNISSQILFNVLEHRQQVQEVVCMLQREVAQRIASPPGNKDYGILSVFLQAYYDIKYEFTVDASVFSPPPNVQSGVISLRRNDVVALPCNEKKFMQVVKQGFNNRRKTLRNALKPLNPPESLQSHPLLDKRAEQLGVAEFVELTTLMMNQE
ncbi:16S rRNA (adenine(1518)-N(6)/adenine(1519)-N(6))-dimethyltransferase RsmA [Larkinella arboricola]|uniref:Ribosomal RNA small subunit methyltransferase A n=1 Tax=Larkinella arboricola TaxID=643671 RepID=A0A327X7N4_LARAB|nr:16S rRNA (adenine(1518)-N(6)/adenine(1519)-N(6))-dimethyltransferase RsmA [Larkinella arboricola]RAK03007.1 16S rRNA (adenine1518-N6/adenine1519-N6)-dimethyltransferase [Larkinella arboricola]